MSSNINDRVTETFNGQNPTSTTVANSRAINGTTLTCNSLAGWPTNTAVHFATYQKNTAGTKVAGTQVDWKGLVSGSSINSLTRQGGAADSGSGVGDVVEMMPTYSWANDLATGLEVLHNHDGTWKSGAALLAPTIADFTNADHTHATTAQGGQLGFTALLSTIFSGQVQTQANAGTAGGTMSYINLGGIKLLWCISANQSTGASTLSYTFTLPVGFFSTITSATSTMINPTSDSRQHAATNSATTTTVTSAVWYPLGGSATCGIDLFVIGT